ncbi:MAG: alpha-galactosidase [Pseudomonadota bacterium]
MTDFYHLDADDTSVVIDTAGSQPVLLYIGPRLANGFDLSSIAVSDTRQEPFACKPEEAPLSLLPLIAAGHTGEPGLEVHRHGVSWDTFPKVQKVSAVAPDRLQIESRCAATGLAVEHEIALHSSGVLSITSTLTNTAEEDLDVIRCDAACIPVLPHFDTITSFIGRWSDEFQRQVQARRPGTYLRENRLGRTSHDCFPGLILHPATSRESDGEVLGFHLGWSGNHRYRVDEDSAGRVSVQMGELLGPGEIRLARGERYRSPTLYCAYSQDGMSGMSRQFHRFVRETMTDTDRVRRPKRVHFNTWEASYFDLDVYRLKALADSAAELGIERFVLDDGWFTGRRSDNAGLGDWDVDTTIFPDGLAPVVDHVQALGMEFGIWFEPEMVNPDSELYRRHPEWALGGSTAPLIESRNQLVLDLTQDAVCDYLFDKVDAFLSTYAATYVKWDMNRNLDQPVAADGRFAVHRQTRNLYRLIDRLRAAHPSVEFESCSSGGARIDFGILERADRFWTSDTNDALDRQRIQRGFSVFLPLELMGAHVGPETCHITGRRLSIETRAATALFGDFGVEANILEMDAAERAGLKEAIALHKQRREFLFAGDLYRLDTDSTKLAFGVVNADKSEALFSVAYQQTDVRVTPHRLRFDGLDRDTSYAVELVYPTAPVTHSTSILDAIKGRSFPGSLLMSRGLQLPIVHPESVLVFRLSAA